MIWWLVLGLTVGSLVVLAAAAVVLLGRLNGLGVAARRLRMRLADAERILPAVTALQRRAERMQEDLVAIQERAEARTKAKTPVR